MTTEELRRALTSRAEVLGLQILTAAMVAGALLFLLVTIVLHATGDGAGPGAGGGDPSLFSILSGVHAVMLVGALTLGFVIHRRFTHDLARADSAAALWNRLRAAAIVRLGLFEGCALFGTVICLLGVVTGEMTDRPWIWGNAASTVLLVGFTAATFPTAERLVREHSPRAW